MGRATCTQRRIWGLDWTSDHWIRAIAASWNIVNREDRICGAAPVLSVASRGDEGRATLSLSARQSNEMHNRSGIV